MGLKAKGSGRLGRLAAKLPQSLIGLLRRPSRRQFLALIILLSAGLGIRLYDLTDPPLDFHETRQLGSAVTARGMYYAMLPDAPAEQTELAAQLWRAVPVYEPPILERLVALTYLLAGAEYLWIARVYSSALWVLGAVGVYSLGRSMATHVGGLLAAGFYLAAPFGVIASRSFQPDPLMTALIVYGLLSLMRWGRQPTLRRAAIAGALGAFAILTKAVALFPLLAAMVGVGWSLVGFRRMFRPGQLWLVAALMALPAAIYHFGAAGERSAGLFSFWVVALRDLVRDPMFFVRWAGQIESVIGFGWLFPSLLGVLLATSPRARTLLFGAWVGYLIYGLALPYQIMTHDYYHLMLVPLVGLGLAPLGAAAEAKLQPERQVWRLAAGGVGLLAFAYLSGRAGFSLASDNFRLEAAGWRRLGEAMPRDGAIVALTHSYGARLQYYAWLQTGFWPGSADIELASLAGRGDFDFEQEFEARTQGARYFLITNFVEFERQPALKDHLYSNYPVYEEGDGYLLFDLGK